MKISAQQEMERERGEALTTCSFDTENNKKLAQVTCWMHVFYLWRAQRWIAASRTSGFQHLVKIFFSSTHIFWDFLSSSKCSIKKAKVSCNVSPKHKQVRGTWKRILSFLLDCPNNTDIWALPAAVMVVFLYSLVFEFMQ